MPLGGHKYCLYVTIILKKIINLLNSISVFLVNYSTKIVKHFYFFCRETFEKLASDLLASIEKTMVQLLIETSKYNGKDAVFYICNLW